MAYEISLHDGSSDWTSPTPNTPLMQRTIEAASEVVTLDLNLYLDLLSTKRVWVINWGYMDATNYALLRAFYDRQFTALAFPELTIPDLSVSSVVVRMDINDHRITDETGLVENVEVVLRETVQATNDYFVS